MTEKKFGTVKQIFDEYIPKETASSAKEAAEQFNEALRKVIRAWWDYRNDERDRSVAMVCADICLYDNIHKYPIPEDWIVDKNDVEQMTRAQCALAIIHDFGGEPGRKGLIYESHTEPAEINDNPEEVETKG